MDGPTFVISVPEIQMLEMTKCSDVACDGQCVKCNMVKGVMTEVCMNLDTPPFDTDPPPLYALFFPYYCKTGCVNIISVLMGYTYVLRHARLVSELPEHAVQRAKSELLMASNTKRASQWGMESRKSTLALCIFYELRILFTMAVFEVVGKGLPDEQVESVFLALLCGNLISTKMRVSTPSDDEFGGFYSNVKAAQLNLT